MARTPSINGYRTTRKPKLKNDNPLNNYQSVNPTEENVSLGNKDLLNNYSNNVPSSTPSTNSNMGTNMSRDITNYAKSPVNSDLDYYTKLTNLRNNNNMLVEKYGLQGVRDQAESELMQQDVLRQQQQRALEEQMRATGINNSGMADTLRSNILSNYNTNVRDIQSDFNYTLNNAIESARLDNYNEVKDTINNLLTHYNSQEVLDAINNADISEQQRKNLLDYYNVAKTTVDAAWAEENPVFLANGVTQNDDGSYTAAGVNIPKELEIFVSSDELLEKLITNLNVEPTGDNYETDKQKFIDTMTDGMTTSEKYQYTPYLEQLFDNKYKSISDKYFEDVANAREKLSEYKENVSNKISEIREGLKNYAPKINTDEVNSMLEKEDVLTNGRLSKKGNEADWSSIYVGDTRYSLKNPETVTEVPNSAKEIKTCK